MRRMGIFLVVAAVFISSGCAPRFNYSVISENSEKCLSLNPFGGYYDGDPAEQWDCSQYHMGLQASWQFVSTGQSNTYQVISIHSGKCLEVNLSSGGKNNGDAVQQSKCTGSDNQKWIVMLGQPNANLKSVHSGKCAEVKLGSTGGLQDGDKIDQWDCTGAKNQTWKLQSITAPNPPRDSGKGELCNVCNPAKPECKPGAQCLIMPSGQSVCGQSCSSAVVCPTGYTCTQVTQLGKTYFQCVPNGNDCPP